MELSQTIFQIFQKPDEAVLFWINGQHTSWLDDLMIFWSEKWVWIPLYGLVVGFIFFKKGARETIWAILMMVLAIALADQLASSFLKPLTQRLRPCHQPELIPLLYLAKGCGGKFGFVSSHAGNSLAFLMSTYFVLPKQKGLTGFLLLWVLIMGISRIYLCAHFPSDVLGGWLIGACSAALARSLILWLRLKINPL
jgi:undecaprenyl-diphosphatase